MRAYRLEQGELVLRECEVPEPGRGQVLVDVRASSLNYRELMVQRGTYPLPVKDDLVPNADGAGVVVAVGPGVTEWAVGDRVAAAVFPLWQHGPFGHEFLPQLGGSLDGMLAERVVLEASGLVRVPDHLSFEEAATLPCAALTAWNALDGVRAGQTVVTRGSGSVSLFAVQFGKLSGARVIATSRGPAKASRLTALGADLVVTSEDWVEEVRAVGGADRVVDVVGALNDSVRALKVSGEVAAVGSLGGGWPPLDPALMFGSVATVRMVAIGSRAQFTAMNRAIAVAGLRPVVDRVFGFEEAAEAYRYYAKGDAFGKVVISMG
ncbi:zinc-dependent alcohol dehydrogenase family protein [Saccharothrix variisporea]|uniref:zinc-dependent alcohol dehydrogenase family protein n=1 Tax=Saccharothrix variisporea TaxID=543527 RepID=UPI000EAE7BFE